MPDTMTVVVLAEEMTDENFYKHYNARHLDDLDILELHPHAENSEATRSLRAYHERCHREGSTEYDHYHE